MEINNSYNRLNKDKIDAQYNSLVNADFINNIFDSLPHIAAVLNNRRQIIFSNQKLLSNLGLSSIERVLGARPGEIIRCEQVHNGSDGCGTSEECKYCGALNVMLTSQRENRKVESECTIVSEINGEKVTFEFGIIINPFEFRSEKYYILSLFDISDSKRRIFLEKLFFHDVINKVGTLNGFLQLIKSVNNPERIEEYIDTLDEISQQLTKEILSQKQLLDAENGLLAVNKELIESKKFLNSIVGQMAKHETAENKHVKLLDSSVSVDFYSDSIILGRIVLNMLKNAVEASAENQTVEVNCVKSNDSVLFSVYNESHMPDEIKTQVFKRSFSTKDSGRGLGTYSMKLFAEKYLNGKIYFESSKENGTTFFLELKTN